ncbi:MAG: enoyl-CoA hydratase [Deltaproteobacteria bacterium]|nr:enoyl-CoA hydratase [Deltaproteobacteria bacterium]
MSHAEVHVTDRDGVRWIELDRPGSKNALTIEVNQALIAAIESAGDARVIVLGGAGGAFCSGLDLKDAMRKGPRPAADMERDLRAYFHGLILAIRNAPQPTIAAVDGAAAGFGCDLALACDLRLLSERARFGEIFVRRGLMPDGGGTWMLPRIIGVGRALELLYTGDQVDAATALSYGLGNRLWPVHEFADQAWAFATRIAAGPPRVLRLVKRAVHDGLESGFEAGLDREARGQLECLGSRDFVEGVAAFLGKRDPRFTGE